MPPSRKKPRFRACREPALTVVAVAVAGCSDSGPTVGEGT